MMMMIIIIINFNLLSVCALMVQKFATILIQNLTPVHTGSTYSGKEFVKVPFTFHAVTGFVT
jgi:hypothetical protein